MRRNLFFVLLGCLSATAAFAQIPPSDGAENHAMFRSSDRMPGEPEEYVMRERPQRAADAPVRWLDVTVEKAGELAAALGEQANEIDSLVVRGSINDDDFMTLWSASFNGDLAVMNLEHATVESGVIPRGAYIPINLRRIMLPEGVTEIADRTFMEARKLETVNLPSTLKRIGESCFRKCHSLKLNPLVLPDGLEEIGDNAFLYCQLQEGEIIFPNSMKRIGAMAFYGCGLSKATLPERLEEMGTSAFESNRLVEVEVPACRFVGESHFADNYNLVRVDLSEGITQITQDFMYHCPIAELTIPTSVDTIRSRAFDSCSLEKLVLPEGLKYIAPYSIGDCKELHIPTTLDRLEVGTFWNLGSLRAIYSASPTPPKFKRDTQSGSLLGPFGDSAGSQSRTPRDATVYVPVGSKKLYEEADGWGDYFSNFVETADLPQASVEGIEADSLDADAPMYDLMGRQITHPAHGQLYIQNGKKRVHWDR